MTNFIARLFTRGEPAFSEARPGDAAAIAAVHGVSFQRGWGEDEIVRLLLENSVVAHRALNGSTLIGFILSRIAAGEAEILSVAIAPASGWLWIPTTTAVCGDEDEGEHARNPRSAIAYDLLLMTFPSTSAFSRGSPSSPRSRSRSARAFRPAARPPPGHSRSLPRPPRSPRRDRPMPRGGPRAERP